MLLLRMLGAQKGAAQQRRKEKGVQTVEDRFTRFTSTRQARKTDCSDRYSGNKFPDLATFNAN